MSDRSGTASPARRPGRRRRIVGRALAGVAALVAVAVATFAIVIHRAQPAHPGAFYALPSPLPNKPPGTVIRSEPLSGTPAGERAWRILYMSTGYTGRPTAVSGMVIVPAHASAAPRNVVAFANGTVGVASNCAPSRQGARVFPLLHGLSQYLAAGDAVAVSDYQGLGTPGPHPYLVGRSEGEDVLDSVRAVHNFAPAHAGTRFAVLGPSQGGHAALFAGQLVPGYAPDLTLVGVAASAPPTDLRELLRIKGEGTFGKVLSAYALDSWSRVYGHDLDAVFRPVARPIVKRMVRLCIQNATQALAFLPLTQILKIGYLKSPPWQTEPWKSLLQQNTPGRSRTPAPILISQGGADNLVHPPLTAEFAHRLCALGDTVDYRVLPGVAHDAGAESAPDTVRWIADRFAGRPAPRSC